MSTTRRALGDIVSLTKPKITLMALLVAIAGLLHAQERPLFFSLPMLYSLLGIALLVSGSSALNMYVERDLDSRMLRTRQRPLPAGRLHAAWAIAIGIACALGASFLLVSMSNMLTFGLGVVSLLLYVGCYTPLKQKSWTSLLVGSIPGAMPVVLGYLSYAGVLDQKALALFMWAFLWQIPHFLAISLFRESEYTAAGFPVMSVMFGVRTTKKILIITSWLLVLSTLGLYLSGVIGVLSFAVALLLGIGFLYICHQGLRDSDYETWARRAFKASLLYQSLLFLLLIFAALG